MKLPEMTKTHFQRPVFCRQLIYYVLIWNITSLLGLNLQSLLRLYYVLIYYVLTLKDPFIFESCIEIKI